MNLPTESRTWTTAALPTSPLRARVWRSKRRKEMLKYGLPSVALVLLVLAVISIARTQPVRKEVAPPAVPATAAYSNQVAAVGLVEAASENISISLPVSGLVTKVDVRAGDHVRKGQPL